MPTPNQARACDGRSAATGRPCSAVATHAAPAPELGAHVYACPEHVAAHPGPWTPLDGRAAGSLPTPEDIARELYGGGDDEAGVANRRCAAKGARAYRDAVCAVLEAEIGRVEVDPAWYPPGSRGVVRAILVAFAARLRGAP